MKTTLTVKAGDLEIVIADASKSRFVNHGQTHFVIGKIISPAMLNSICLNEAVFACFPFIREQIESAANAERDRILQQLGGTDQNIVHGYSFKVEHNLTNWAIILKKLRRQSIAHSQMARHYKHVTR